MSEPVEISNLSDDELLAAYGNLDPNSTDGDFLFAEMQVRGLDHRPTAQSATNGEPG